MDATAIEKIEALAMRSVSINTHDDCVIVPAGYQVISTDKFRDHRQYMAGTYKTENVVQYARYIADELNVIPADGKASVFINGSTYHATALLDYRVTGNEAGHHVHRATLAPPYTPEWLALQTLCADFIDQEAVVDWLEEWPHTLLLDDSMSASALVSAFREVVVTRKTEATQHLEETARERSAMERVEAKNKNYTPKALVFRVQPFDAFEPREINVTVRTKVAADGSIRFRFRMLHAAAHAENIAMEFAGKVGDALHTAIKGDASGRLAVYVGEFGSK